jgi:nucleotide-binding universal stress UspA family protein
VSQCIVEGSIPSEVILEVAEACDLIVLGAADEPVFQNILVGPDTERIARRAKITVMLVKRLSSPLHSFVRKAPIEPTKPKPLQ